MTPEQSREQLQQELAANTRLASLLRDCAKDYADAMYRRMTDVTDHASLLRLTGVAAGVEAFVEKLLPARLPDSRANGEK